jgi:putative heme-binding domain-containing protein
LTIDLGPGATPGWEWLNVEGIGFGGAANVLPAALEFQAFRQLTIVVRDGAGGVRLWVDGQAQGQRDKNPARLRAEQLLVGARTYSNEARPPYVQGFFDGDLAEVLVFDRALPEDQRAAVEGYLRAKYEGVRPLAGTAVPGSKPLVSVVPAPAVQMFVPGFEVRELPVRLSNVNNVRYRSDGTLVAVAYSGDVYLLKDTDGDSLEDHVSTFWQNDGRLRSPIGMAVTPPGFRHGPGVLVASTGKLSLLVDADGDDRAEREWVLAQGWKPLPHGVDTLGVAVDGQGQVYFGLGTTDFTNAYQTGADGRAAYDLQSERGTILKMSADLSRREVVATGIRFPVGLAFNSRGDLFATDQEGATWLPNGNPLDELLHIQPGRHYGFPPRHPRHLPGVIDEPSVWDYEPQHQSTCGLAFNEACGPGGSFGPAWWQGHALVAGYSRGKIYRTRLTSTPHGYLADTALLGTASALVADLCVSPRGELVLAAHSGAPDWGSGPTGQGKLFQIRYRDREAPQPVLAWSAGPGEVRMAFDRQLAVERLRGLAERARIERGEFVFPGDRFESLRPGYAVVAHQLAAPRFEVPVLSLGVSADSRTLALATPAGGPARRYAVSLSGLAAERSPEGWGLAQHDAVEVGYDLSGIDARWRPADCGQEIQAWLPLVDLAAARALTDPSGEHRMFWSQLQQPGTLTLRTRLDLWQMLRPAVQPGSQLDYVLPAERVAVVMRGSGLGVAAGGKPLAVTTDAQGIGQAVLEVEPQRREPVELEIRASTGPQLALTAWTRTREDPRPRAIPRHRLWLPWAHWEDAGSGAPRQALPAELAGGDWARGREVFYSAAAQCGTCHQVRGVGARIGPDLSNLVHRDYASVLRDLRTPSAAINPDYLAAVVELDDGRVLSGLARTVGERLLVVDGAGRETAVERASVEAVRPSARSIMPEGIDAVLGPERLKDLLTFLLSEPLAPAPLERTGAPPPRSLAELAAPLAAGEVMSGPPRPLRVVLAAGPKDHGPGEHDYPLWQRRWHTLLSLAEGVEVEVAQGWPSAEQWSRANLVVFYSNNPQWHADRAGDVDGLLARGGGLALIHYAVDGHQHVDALAQRIGLAWQGGRSRFRHGRLELAFPQQDHPITRGLGPLQLEDESYWNLAGQVERVEVLATGQEEGQAQPLVWVRQQGAGRVFVSIPGHYTWTFDDPLFRLLILRGLAWAAGEPVDRLAPLAAIGARAAP